MPEQRNFDTLKECFLFVLRTSLNQKGETKNKKSKKSSLAKHHNNSFIEDMNGSLSFIPTE